MFSPGDVSRFGAGFATPASQLNALAQQVAATMGMRAAPPLAIDYTNAGILFRLDGFDLKFAKLTTQDGTNNKWGWKEQATKPDGTIADLDGGFVGTATQNYAVPITGSGSANAVGICVLKGDYFDFWPLGGTKPSVLFDVGFSGNQLIANGNTYDWNVTWPSAPSCWAVFSGVAGFLGYSGGVQSIAVDTYVNVQPNIFGTGAGGNCYPDSSGGGVGTQYVKYLKGATTVEWSYLLYFPSGVQAGTNPITISNTPIAGMTADALLYGSLCRASLVKIA